MNPANDFWYLVDQMDRMSQEMLSRTSRSQVMTLPVDIFDRGDEFVVQAFVPGVRAEHLEVQIDDGVLTISGSFPTLYDVEDAGNWTWYSRELRTGDFQRSINLPYKVEHESVSAEVIDGLFKLTLPKAAEARPFRIAIGETTKSTPEIAEVETNN